MRSRMLKLTVISVLMLSFFAVGCKTECERLKDQLDDVRLDIFDTQLERKAVDAQGTNMGKALELAQKEENLRKRYKALSKEYIAKGCEGKTGEVPPLPPEMTINETLFE